MRALEAAVLCLLLGSLPLAMAYDSSGRCETYLGPSGLCYPPPALIYVNATFDQTQAAENVQSLLRFTSLVSTECARDAIAFLCASNFRQCVYFNYTDSSGVSASAALAIPPCASVCTAAVSSCASFFNQAGIALPDCSLYPLNSTTEDIPAANQTLDLECEPARNFSTAAVTCFEPFLYPVAGRRFHAPSGANEALWSVIPAIANVCGIPCPNPTFAQSYWDGLRGYSFGAGLLSLALCVLTVVPVFFYKERRTFPSILIIHLNNGAILSALFSILGFFPRSRGGAQCQSSVEWSQWGSSGAFCVLQGLLLIVSQQLLLWFSAAIGVNMFVNCVLRIRLPRLAVLAFYAIPYSGVIGFFIYAIATKSIAPILVTPGCGPGNAKTFIYGPFYALGTISFVTTAATMAWLAFISLRTKVGTAKDKLLSALGAQWRLGVFGTMVVFPYFLLIADSNLWPISKIVGLYFEYLVRIPSNTFAHTHIHTHTYTYTHKQSRAILTLHSFARQACTYAGQSECRLHRFPSWRAYLEVSSYLYIGLLIFLCFTVRLNYIVDAWRVLRTLKRRKEVDSVNVVEMSTSGSI